MIYEITEKLKEYLIEKNDVFIEQKEEEEAKAVEAAKQLEQSMKGIKAEARLNYTPVTPESFNEWDHRFNQEMEEKRRQDFLALPQGERKLQEQKDGRLTGKQFFMQRNVQELDDDDEEAKEEEKTEEQLCYDEELFDDEDLDDVDLD